jgi:hypothetical protein
MKVLALTLAVLALAQAQPQELSDVHGLVIDTGLGEQNGNVPDAPIQAQIDVLNDANPADCDCFRFAPSITDL